MSSPNAFASSFVFVACQPAATRFCRQEIAALHPDWLPAFSRPGYLTWKIPAGLAARFELPATFARTFGFSGAPFRTTDRQELVREISRTLESGPAIDLIHVWDRKWSAAPIPGQSDANSEILQLYQALRQQFPRLITADQTARPDAQVLDVVLIDPGHWGLGRHVAGTTSQRWPGGVPTLVAPDELASRAWLKTAEALAWSGIPLTRGDVCLEIGAAPGGSCQRLLELGARVIAVDPAELDPRVANHKDLVHLKMRGRDVPHRRLASAKWLLVDTNIAPWRALEMSEALVTSQHTRFRGLLLTLKMLDAGMVSEIDQYMARARSWGYRYVKTRHLAWGRREICLAALKQKSVRRFRK